MLATPLLDFKLILRQKSKQVLEKPQQPSESQQFSQQNSIQSIHLKFLQKNLPLYLKSPNLIRLLTQYIFVEHTDHLGRSGFIHLFSSISTVFMGF